MVCFCTSPPKAGMGLFKHREEHKLYGTDNVCVMRRERERVRKDGGMECCAGGVNPPPQPSVDKQCRKSPPPKT